MQLAHWRYCPTRKPCSETPISFSIANPVRPIRSASRDCTLLKCLCTRAFGLASTSYFLAKFLFSTAVQSTSFAHDLKDQVNLT
ncbi:MAG: hypothetical protein QOG58_908 [Caballeronia sp.]|nr:hypothetical protein [Caballeronia sp.]